MISVERAKRIFGVVAVLVALFTAGASAKDVQWHYIDPSQVDLTVLLPPPPDFGSNQESSDEQQVAATVAESSHRAVTTAEDQTRRTVFFFEPSVGPWFTPARLPLTAQLFARVGSDVEKLVDGAKSYWDRPRPNGTVKGHGSYPSGHAAFGACAAIVLSEMLPEKRDAIFNQARSFAENRIILGLHYPSDIASGWTAGTLAAQAMMHNTAFQLDFDAAKAELRKAYQGQQHS